MHRPFLIVFFALVISYSFSSSVDKPSDSKCCTIPDKKLSPKGEMPMVGLGTFQAKDEELESAVDVILKTGYRHIDTAYVYGNEDVIGRVIKKWIDSGKIKREDLFIVTKLPPGGNRPSGVSKYVNKSLKSLQMDYVDLYLIHTPFAFPDVEENAFPFDKDGNIMLDKTTDLIAVWKEMEKQVENNKARAIGLSNFNKTQIERILANSAIKPAALQIELHAYYQQNELVKFCKDKDIVVTAYSPLGSPGFDKFLALFGQEADIPNILHDSVVTEIASKYNRSAAQILLRHIAQRGITVIPKSIHEKRLQENFNVFDFKLAAEDIDKLNALDKGDNGRLFDFKSFKGVEKHPEYPFQNQ